MKEYFEYWFEKKQTLVTIRYSNKAYLYNPSELDLIDFDEWIDKLSSSVTFSAVLTLDGFELVVKQNDDLEVVQLKQAKWEEFKSYYQNELDLVWKKKRLNMLYK